MSDSSSIPTPLRAAPTLKDLLVLRRPTLPQVIWLAICVLVFAALLRWTMHDFPLSQVWQGFRSAHLNWLVCTIALFFAGQLLRCLRWQHLLKCDVPTSLGDVGKPIMDGQIINWLSPIRLGDVWRAWQAMQTGGRNGLWVAGSILLEKSADSLVLALYALILLFTPLPFPTHNILLRLGLGGLAGLLIFGGLLALRPNTWRTRALARLPQSWQSRLASERLMLSPTLQKNIRAKSTWMELVAFSLGIWVVAVATNVALAQALGIQLTWTQQLFFILAIQLGTVVSTVPANIGLFPLVALGVFSVFGLDRAQALTFGSVLYVLVYTVNFTLWLGWNAVARATRHTDKFAKAQKGLFVKTGERINIAGAVVDTYDFDTVVAKVLEHIESGKPPAYVLTPNAAHILLQQNNPSLKKIYQEALLSVPDGVGVVWAARFLGTPVAERVNGTDLFESLCAKSNQNGLRVFFLGWREGAVEKAAENLKKRHPALKIAGTYCPSDDFENSPQEVEHIRSLITTAQPHLLFVGLGCPRQEIWIYKNHQMLGVPVSLGIGASFDFVSGLVHRAPVWMQQAGLEWAYRLACEPGRLWRRYLLGNPKFVLQIICQKLGILKNNDAQEG